MSISKVLRFIAACPLSVVASYLMWLVYYWLTPKVMQVHTVPKLLLFVLVLEPLVVAAITLATSFCGGALAALTGKLPKRLRWIFALPFLFHGYSSLMIPWRAAPEGTISVLMAVAISFYVVISYGAAIYFISVGHNDND